MGKFLKRGFLFAIPLFLVIGFAYPLDKWLSHFLASHSSIYYVTDEYAVWNDIFSGQIDSDLVIQGSSRAWLHFNPAMLKEGLGFSSYNLGVDGHNFWLQYFRHSQYLEHNKKPKVIVYSVDYGTLEKVDKEMYNYNYQQFLPYMLGSKDIQIYTSDYIVFNKWSSTLPLLRYSGEFSLLKDAVMMELSGDSSRKKRKKGFAGIQQKWNSDLERAKRKSPGITVEIDSGLIKKFEDYIYECKQKEINIIMVYAPIHDFGAAYIKNHEEITEMYRDLANKHDLRFLDYSTHEISKDQANFYNSTHLNSYGANKFTQQLVKDIKMLGWQADL
ncbi:MAG: hypothetical protein AAFX53_09505 [Bacteroidota bacterium]